MNIIQNIQNPDFFAHLTQKEIDTYSTISKNPRKNPDTWKPHSIEWVSINNATCFSDVHTAQEVVNGINILSQSVMGEDLSMNTNLEHRKMAMRSDAPASQINPKHYQSDGIQVIDVIESFGLGFDLGNAVKYILRAGKKDSEEQDLRKAIWYILHHLKLEPQNNQLMANEFLTDERINALRDLVETLKNFNNDSQVDADLIASNLRELFPID